jgi:oligoribonuclease (3'-5' exoribonuclease)
MEKMLLRMEAICSSGSSVDLEQTTLHYVPENIVCFRIVDSSSIKSRRMRWAGHVARMGEKRNAYRILVGEPEGKKALGRPIQY